MLSAAEALYGATVDAHERSEAAAWASSWSSSSKAAESCICVLSNPDAPEMGQFLAAEVLHGAVKWRWRAMAAEDRAAAEDTAVREVRAVILGENMGPITPERAAVVSRRLCLAAAAIALQDAADYATTLLAEGREDAEPPRLLSAVLSMRPDDRPVAVEMFCEVLSALPDELADLHSSGGGDDDFDDEDDLDSVVNLDVWRVVAAWLRDQGEHVLEFCASIVTHPPERFASSDAPAVATATSAAVRALSCWLGCSVICKDGRPLAPQLVQVMGGSVSSCIFHVLSESSGPTFELAVQAMQAAISTPLPDAAWAASSEARHGEVVSLVQSVVSAAELVGELRGRFEAAVRAAHADGDPEAADIARGLLRVLVDLLATHENVLVSSRLLTKLGADHTSVDPSRVAAAREVLLAWLSHASGVTRGMCDFTLDLWYEIGASLGRAHADTRAAEECLPHVTAFIGCLGQHCQYGPAGDADSDDEDGELHGVSLRAFRRHASDALLSLATSWPGVNHCMKALQACMSAAESLSTHESTLFLLQYVAEVFCDQRAEVPEEYGNDSGSRPPIGFQSARSVSLSMVRNAQAKRIEEREEVAASWTTFVMGLHEMLHPVLDGTAGDVPVRAASRYVASAASVLRRLSPWLTQSTQLALPAVSLLTKCLAASVDMLREGQVGMEKLFETAAAGFNEIVCDVAGSLVICHRRQRAASGQDEPAEVSFRAARSATATPAAADSNGDIVAGANELAGALACIIPIIHAASTAEVLHVGGRGVAHLVQGSLSVLCCLADVLPAETPVLAGIDSAPFVSSTASELFRSVVAPTLSVFSSVTKSIDSCVEVEVMCACVDVVAAACRGTAVLAAGLELRDMGSLAGIGVDLAVDGCCQAIESCGQVLEGCFPSLPLEEDVVQTLSERFSKLTAVFIETLGHRAAPVASKITELLCNMFDAIGDPNLLASLQVCVRYLGEGTDGSVVDWSCGVVPLLGRLAIEIAHPAAASDGLQCIHISATPQVVTGVFNVAREFLRRCGYVLLYGVASSDGELPLLQALLLAAAATFRADNISRTGLLPVSRFAVDVVTGGEVTMSDGIDWHDPAAALGIIMDSVAQLALGAVIGVAGAAPSPNIRGIGDCLFALLAQAPDSVVTVAASCLNEVILSTVTAETTPTVAERSAVLGTILAGARAGSPREFRRALQSASLVWRGLMPATALPGYVGDGGEAAGSGAQHSVDESAVVDV